MDKISILMGIYNCADTLPRAIESIVNQTYTNWELILCDDASADNTYAVAQEYRDRYPDKIILLRNTQNMRLAATLNHCLQYATGTYISRMDGDDESAPDRFEKQVAYLISHPDVDLVGTAVMRINDGKRFLLDSISSPDYFTLRNSPPFHHATILTYKYVYDACNGYTVAERTRRAEDLDLWFKFYKNGFVGANLKEPLYIVYENHASVARRKASDRWLTFQIQCHGFRMLGYPSWWIIKPFFRCLIRFLCPHWVQNLYRKYQHTKSEQRFSTGG